jgi:phage terminase Nu1 subunit (DNA packaging protein)
MVSTRKTTAKPRKPAVQTVGAKEICRFLAGQGQEAITEMRLSQLVREGLPKSARGEYDPIVCMHWYLGKLRPAVQRKSTEGDDGAARNLTDEKARLTAAQADTAEMDRDERRGLLIPVEVYEQRLGSWAITTKQLLLALATRLAPKLEGLPRAKLRIVLEEALKGCLIDVATGRALPAADASPKPARKPRKGRRGDK